MSAMLQFFPAHPLTADGLWKANRYLPICLSIMTGCNLDSIYLRSDLVFHVSRVVKELSFYPFVIEHSGFVQIGLISRVMAPWRAAWRRPETWDEAWTRARKVVSVRFSRGEHQRRIFRAPRCIMGGTIGIYICDAIRISRGGSVMVTFFQCLILVQNR